MARRPRREQRHGEGGETGIPRDYEGPLVLSELLSRAGSPHDAGEVADRFRRAQAKGEERADVIPTLFADEPRFGEPGEARRLYGNLFALWDRVAQGVSIAEDLPAVETAPARREPAPLPPRGAARGGQLGPPLIESVWKHLDALSEREKRRWRDRMESAQPQLVAWLDAVSLPDESLPAAHDLVFETWAMFDVAFGDRVAAVEFRDLRAQQSEPPALEAVQPALAAYVSEALDLVAEEDPAFGAASRALVERVVATVAYALAGALVPEEDA
jgi:hypothetical protein